MILLFHFASIVLKSNVMRCYFYVMSDISIFILLLCYMKGGVQKYLDIL